ncbi:hypothetical protein QYE76_007001 [Lolium multiflorum]|uniref:GAG-pre-integrase domain-containing protein n=1 Tax=Lolium multiflorum TaxID=4521 RepID=A0AAD8W4W8_LOLMU|nr:hypothetical protein QYE76_007001 [Lolium multiflorum]
MSNNPGMLSTLAPARSRIVVGNGSTLPVSHSGSLTIPISSHPLHLHDILVSPSLIKNLLSVKRLCRDNLGFCVKDRATRTVILRCNSGGDLYPVRVSPPSSISLHATAVSADVWHQRLGHPGCTTLSRALLYIAPTSYEFLLHPLRISTPKALLCHHVVLFFLLLFVGLSVQSSPPGADARVGPDGSPRGLHSRAIEDGDESSHDFSVCEDDKSSTDERRPPFLADGESEEESDDDRFSWGDFTSSDEAKEEEEEEDDTSSDEPPAKRFCPWPGNLSDFDSDDVRRGKRGQ